MNNKVRLIDANALDFESGTDPNDPTADMCYIRAEDIDKAPAIEAEPVRNGQWFHNSEWGVHCSVCNGYEPNGDAIFFTYCPNCGAKMDGGEKV